MRTLVVQLVKIQLFSFRVKIKTETKRSKIVTKYLIHKLLTFNQINVAERAIMEIASTLGGLAID
jgi:hypothetical protein